jgi:hypothetical protein
MCGIAREPPAKIRIRACGAQTHSSPSAVQTERTVQRSPTPFLRLRSRRSQLAVIRHTLETLRHGESTSVGLDDARAHPAPTPLSGYNVRKPD